MGIMNYYHFTIVCGFFVGILTALVNIERGPFVFLMIALAVPVFFYFIIHLAISIFIRYSDDNSITFDKVNYEKAIDRYYNELLTKEIEIDDAYKFTSELEEEMGKLYQRNLERKKRKKRVRNA
jgi:hypothetical protein